MEGDGLWMRCSKCQHVFFQDNPLKVKPVVLTQEENNSEPLQTVRRPAFEPAARVVDSGRPDDDVKSFLTEVMAPEATTDFRGDEQTKPFGERHAECVADIDFSGDAENVLEEDATNEAREVELPRKKSRFWKIALWTLLVVIVIPAIAYFVLFPDLGSRYVRIAEKLIGAGISQPTAVQEVAGQIKLLDVRQRVVNNYILGNLRVVEGTAVNMSDFSVSRIRVKGETLDAYSVVLSEKGSYAGNILSDEELMNLPEEDLAKRLNMPEGRDNSNEKVIPNGRIPFMIVFTKDQPSAIKTTVMVAGAEKLL